MSLILILLLVVLGGGALIRYIDEEFNVTSPYYLSSDDPVITLCDKDGNELNFIRGTQVDIRARKVTFGDIEYNQLVYNDEVYLVEDANLVLDKKDCVKEKELYALRDHVLTSAYDDFHIADFIKKGTKLEVSGFHEIQTDGNVDYYEVNNTGYISSKYVSKQYYES